MPRIKTAPMPRIEYKLMTFHLLLGLGCSVFGQTAKGQFFGERSRNLESCILCDPQKFKKIITAGGCNEGWLCKPRDECPAFKEKQAKLDGLTSFSSEWLEVLSQLKGLECEEAENGFCCKIEGTLTDFE